MPAIFPAEIPSCHNIYPFRLAIDAPSLDSSREREGNEDTWFPKTIYDPEQTEKIG
jgi:hypothetical protein